MAIEGEELEGVYGGNSLLENQNHPDYTNKKLQLLVAEMLQWTAQEQ